MTLRHSNKKSEEKRWFTEGRIIAILNQAIGQARHHT